LLEFNKTSIFLTDFRNYSTIIFYAYPSSGSRIVLCRRADRRTDRHIEIFAKVSKYRFLGNEVLSYIYAEQTGLALTLQTFVVQNSEWVNLS